MVNDAASAMAIRMSETRYLLFDWYSGGHHEIYLSRFAEVLHELGSVAIAAPEVSADRLRSVTAAFHALPPRPRVNFARHFERETVRTNRQEVELLRELIARTRPSHAIHMFADRVLLWLSLGRVGAPTTVLVFRPRTHYPRLYGSPLTLRARMLGLGHDLTVGRWRRSPDAHSILCLDEGAVAMWNAHPGAPAFWLPEPPLATDRQPQVHRSGCLIIGSLGPRKGIHLVARALAGSATDVSIKIVGPVEFGFRDELDRQVRLIERSGGQVELRLRPFSESEGLELMGSAQCVLVPYVGHIGMSRVLVEACAAGTPVVATDQGLIGHLVRTHQLGKAVDVRDPVAFRGAIEEFTQDREVVARFQAALKSFASGFSSDRFREALMSGVEGVRA